MFILQSKKSYIFVKLIGKTRRHSSTILHEHQKGHHFKPVILSEAFMIL